MFKQLKYLFVLISIALINDLYSQNQNKKWYFGKNAALDFMSSPPVILSNNAMQAFEGCSSIADINGNLMFYTDGETVWNNQHQIMQNGTGLFGDPSASQSGLIIKKPGSSNIYYIFTTANVGGANGLRYTTVDMNLAAGLGAVTIKNTLIVTPTTEHLAATRHCNGVDIWLLSHDYPGLNFRATLITTSGVSTTPVISSGSTNISNGTLTQGCLKISPTGKRIGWSSYFINNGPAFELDDFDNSTGIVSSPLVLPSNTQGYSCEFSADGSMFYGGAGFNSNSILQWNLCAGSNAAIIASQFSITATITGELQRATDQKIYIAHIAKQYLGVINNPNAAGLACNYVDNGQMLAPGTSSLGLPNILFEKIPPGPFTYTVIPTSCTTVSFTPPPPPTITVTACTEVGYSLTNLTWNFGDPASGSNNTSTIANPTHVFPGPGTYTTQLVYYYTCGGGTDTIEQVVTVGNLPVTSTQGFTVCNGQSITLSASGNTVYSWSTGANTSSIIVSPSVTTTYSVNGTTAAGCTNSAVLTVTVVPPPVINISGSNTVCPGSSVIQTASGVSNYTWSTGVNTNTASLNPSITTVYNVSGTNGAGCISTASVMVNVISTGVVSVNDPTACIGSAVTLSVINNPGAFTYTWYPGAVTGSSISVSPASTSNYTLIAEHAVCNLSTSIIATVNVNAIVPAITGFNYNTPVCANSENLFPITVSGFNNGGVFSAPDLNINPLSGEIILSPLNSGSFTVTYSFAAAGCTTAASSTATLIVLPVADLTVSNNVNIIPGASTTLSVSGALSYTWSPSSYLSCINCEDPIATPPDNIQYCVSSELNSCISKKCIDITVSCETGNDHSIPNAFTPNGDGHNDAFCLQGWTDCITNFNVMIFDRWGERVFQSNDPSFCWDGIYKGELMNAGVFVYIIKATKQKASINKKGNITLIR